MQAIRQFHKVENGAITVQLPADFCAAEVEVIVLPMQPAENGIHPEQVAVEEAYQSFLSMDTSNFTPEQLKAYERSCERLRIGRKPGGPRMFGLFEGLVEIADDFDTLPDEYIDLFYADNIFPQVIEQVEK